MKARVDYRALARFKRNLSRLNQEQTQQFTEEAVKELASRLLRKVRFRTPVYKNIPGDINAHTGGELRRSWTIGEVIKAGDEYTIEVFNPLKYATYVEFGHRGVYVPEAGITLHLNRRWTFGKFMLTISEQELKREGPVIIERKLRDFVRRLFDD